MTPLKGAIPPTSFTLTCHTPEKTAEVVECFYFVHLIQREHTLSPARLDRVVVQFLPSIVHCSRLEGLYPVSNYPAALFDCSSRDLRCPKREAPP